MYVSAGDSAGVFLGVGNDDNDDAPADVDDEDIDFLDHADRFEKAYNFRCESRPAGYTAGSHVWWRSASEAQPGDHVLTC